MSHGLPQLMFVTSLRVMGHGDIHQAKKCLATIISAYQPGSVVVHIREPQLEGREFFELCEIYSAIIKKYRQYVFINDRVDIAVAVKADGVHLPSLSYDVEWVKKHFSSMIVGKACHSVEEVKNLSEAVIHPDYVTLSPIFSTLSKPDVKSLGLDELAQATYYHLPIFALGGMTHLLRSQVLATGAHGIAMLSGAWEKSLL